MSVSLLDPLFATADETAFTERHLAKLASGTLGAVRVPEFFSQELCQAAMDSLERLTINNYDAARVATPIARFGPALNDYRTDDSLDAARYWAAAEEARVAWQKAAMRPDPIAVALRLLGSAWGASVVPATIAGRPVFGGTLREINAGALVHYDDVCREYPTGIFDQDIIAQLAFNAWISVSDEGGVTTVWRRQWKPEDEQHRDSYGYEPIVVEGSQYVTHAPQRGDALLFNPVNFHGVSPCCGGRRVAFAFFLGLTTAGQLIAWS